MRCLIIGKVWPEPTATAAGRRTLDVIRALSVAGYELSFACAAVQGAEASDLCVLGVATYSIRLNDSSFDEWLQELEPDVVIFDRFMTEEQFGWRVENTCPSAMRILDTSDLHCLRAAREQALKRGQEVALGGDVVLREVASIYRCDLTLVISEYEMQVLQERLGVPESLLYYWPFGVELKSACGAGFEARNHCILIGSFMHAPNLDAARWLKAEVWPLVRKELPGVALHCYGSYGERYGGQLNAPKIGFYYKGRAPDALEAMRQYRLNLAPLRFGAGLKGKLFDGFETGTPTIATSIAIEGIANTATWPTPVADNAAGFANAVVGVYQDATAWNAAVESERALVVQSFNRGDLYDQLPRKIEALKVDLRGARAANLVGQMLRHHQHRSTEYMSRWIELKNRQELEDSGLSG